MKKLTLLLLALCMVVGMFCFPIHGADVNANSYTASYGTPKIDGAADDVWDLAPWETLTKNAASNKMSVRFKVLHDDTKIYFLVEANDPSPSSKMTECVWFNLHAHKCSNPYICTEYTQHFMTVNGNIWDNVARTNAAKDNYRVVTSKTSSGTLYTMEWSYRPAAGIPKDNQTYYGLDFLVDDYTADNSWIDKQQTWNAADAAALSEVANYGKLYFKSKTETEMLGDGLFYNDVATTDAAYQAILYTSTKGIFVPASASNPSFNPNTTLSRAQFVTILGRLAGVDTSAYKTTAFPDVSFTRDSWYAAYAEWARVNGIVAGINGKFSANTEISVAQAILMLQRYAQTIEGRDVSKLASIAGYTDAASVPSWAKTAMQWAAMNKLYPFSGKALTPNQTMTRAMTAMLIYNYDMSNTNADGTPKIALKAPPTNIKWEEEVTINALKFGFVNDGKTPNDGIMAYYIEHYADTIPLEFPAGTYAFEHSIHFPSNVFMELAPKAELLLISDTVQEYFITLQKDVTDWGGFEDYAQQAYIRGGRINANYQAKVGIGLHGGMHTNFADFKLYNVLEKGIVTEIGKGVANGCYTFNNLYLYNDKAVTGTVAFYDNSPDNTYFKCTAVNFQTFIYTGNGMFTQCSGWFNSYGSSLVKDSVYAIVTGGQQSVFYNPLVDTYRYGFQVINGASTSIHDLVWITNKNFYSDATRAQYPMRVFTTDNANVRIMVNGISLWANTTHFDFADRALPNSVFLNVRYPSGWNPATTMAYFRNDTANIFK